MAILALSQAAIDLPTPRTSGGTALFDALARRHSTRAFASTPLSDETLGQLLWCACGVNRGATGGHTAPSAKNWREIDVYVARADGAYVYEPASHRLKPVQSRDVRAATGLQDFVAHAPIDLVYVADLSRVDTLDPLERRFYCAADAAFIAQNVYLACAAEGLGCVVRGLLDRRALATALGLREDQRVLLAQTIGHPAV